MEQGAQRALRAVIFILLVFILLIFLPDLLSRITEEEEKAIAEAEVLLGNPNPIIEFCFMKRDEKWFVARHIFEDFAGGLHQVILKSQVSNPREFQRIIDWLVKTFSKQGIVVQKEDNGITLLTNASDKHQLFKIFKEYAKRFSIKIQDNAID